jgi:hypothetical protein
MAGRPSIYSDELAELICKRLIEGESLRKICADEGMPDRSTVVRWLADPDHAEFCQQYGRAREAQSDLMDDLILDVANSCTAETAAADRVKIGAYQWRASKLAPKKYGDKLEHAGSIALRHEDAVAILEREEREQSGC